MAGILIFTKTGLAELDLKAGGRIAFYVVIYYITTATLASITGKYLDIFTAWSLEYKLLTVAILEIQCIHVQELIFQNTFV